MFFLFISCVLATSLKEDLTFEGKGYVIHTNQTKINMNITDFHMTISKGKSVLDQTVYTCSLDFFWNNQYEADTKYELFGLEYDNITRNFFFFRDTTHNKLNKSIYYLNDLIKLHKKDNIHEVIHEIIQENFMPVVLTFNISDQKSNSSVFAIDKHLHGFFTMMNITLLNLDGEMFDMVSYVGEGRTFGVILAICIAANVYAWYSIQLRYGSKALLAQLSEHSLLLHIGYDFSLIFFTLDMSMLSQYFTTLYLLLFFVMILVYFIIQMQVLAVVWAANHSIGENDPTREIQMALMFFFMEVSIIITISSSTSTIIFQYPFPCIIFLYTPFIPQIYHSVKNPRRMRNNYIFVTIVYLTRLVPLLYFTFYKRNIMRTSSPIIGIITFVFLTVQVLIVYLQNWIGGDFFLPKKLRQQAFNYSSMRDMNHDECSICLSQIEADDPTMTPPCGHTFHRACLHRWMDEELICPVCRSPLPVDAEDV
ncbi:hypothetical protein TRFO_14584 [Tritrichomonas foetus]|uniref:RING-type E3 ubiquitin transferase n=1 Tax=Tritrichomonas foetus TaxID=1144522 RepID=A0A1J4KZ05_9EUKA|nr:hypothetical protein TRFO_14584 [Tritrichomonas foetus]|eukprot:OHT14942.1 hypothetical protein TRFO_14584 [Tritrichomonas foetus]